MGILSGKKILVMGVANSKSIAWGCAQAMEEQGAQIIYTYLNERIKKFIVKLVPDENRLIECDVNSDESIAQAFAEISQRFGKIDGILHAIAFARREELGGSVLNTTRDGYQIAQDTSSYSLIAVAKEGVKILNNPASLVTLTYMGSQKAVPNYNVMGIAKAALESSVRYLARDLAEYGVRVNAISAGAIKTLAVSGIQGSSDLLKYAKSMTVDDSQVTQAEVGNTCAFLMSEMASGIDGDIVYVDHGAHIK